MVAVLLAGCAQSPDVVQGPQTPVGSASPSPKPTAKAKVSDELAAALAKWKDFPAEADPRPLLIMRNVSGGGFNTGEAKMAFMDGNWTVPDELPETPEEFGGYPVIGAADALAVLRGDQAGGKSGVDALAVESLRLVTVKDVPTDRGTKKLPAWRVDFEDASEPWFVVAVAPSARYDSSAVQPYSYPDGSVVGTESAIDLTVSHGGSVDDPGPCGADYRIETAESDNAVAYRVVQIERPTSAPSDEPVTCPAALYGRRTPMTLEKPLGNRILLSVWGDQVAVASLVEPKPERVAPE